MRVYPFTVMTTGYPIEIVIWQQLTVMIISITGARERQEVREARERRELQEAGERREVGVFLCDKEITRLQRIRVNLVRKHHRNHVCCGKATTPGTGGRKLSSSPK
jgi:hypothetical protein